MPIDALTFRNVMSQFAAGVTVVTMRHDEQVRGMTANAFCAVSLDPPLVLVCVVNGGTTNALLRAAGHFAVNILREDQERLSDRFAGRSADERGFFDDIPLRESVSGAPVFWECLAYADCRVVSIHEAGDHTIFVGEVLDGDVLSDAPRWPIDIQVRLLTMNGVAQQRALFEQ